MYTLHPYLSGWLADYGCFNVRSSYLKGLGERSQQNVQVNGPEEKNHQAKI